MINEDGKNTKADKLANRAETRKVINSVREELKRSKIEPNSPIKKILLNKCSGPEWPKIELKNFQSGELAALKPGSNPWKTCNA